MAKLSQVPTIIRARREISLLLEPHSNRFTRAKLFMTFELKNGTAEHPFMDLTTGSRVCSPQGDNQGTTSMRKMILGAASALALASPAVAADLQVTLV